MCSSGYGVYALLTTVAQRLHYHFVPIRVVLLFYVQHCCTKVSPPSPSSVGQPGSSLVAPVAGGITALIAVLVAVIIIVFIVLRYCMHSRQ